LVIGQINDVRQSLILLTLVATATTFVEFGEKLIEVVATVAVI